ncbi:hypothetical protein [Coleofasciculus sp. FACHB-542]|nr:hypothetical protein [Coleofasciculus sp. FACHB-542]
MAIVPTAIKTLSDRNLRRCEETLRMNEIACHLTILPDQIIYATI